MSEVIPGNYHSHFYRFLNSPGSSSECPNLRERNSQEKVQIILDQISFDPTLIQSQQELERQLSENIYEIAAKDINPSPSFSHNEITAFQKHILNELQTSIKPNVWCSEFSYSENQIKSLSYGSEIQINLFQEESMYHVRTPKEPIQAKPPSVLIELETLGEGAFGRVKRILNAVNSEFYAQKQILGKQYIYEYEVNMLRQIQQLGNPDLIRMVDCDNEVDMRIKIEYGYLTLSDFVEYALNDNIGGYEPIFKYLLLNLCYQLCFLNKNGIAHFDIKPDNIIFSLASQPKIIDFNLAQKVDKNGQFWNFKQGSTQFRAPELWFSYIQKGTHPINKENALLMDLFSLGSCFWKLVGSLFPQEHSFSKIILSMLNTCPQERLKLLQKIIDEESPRYEEYEMEFNHFIRNPSIRNKIRHFVLSRTLKNVSKYQEKLQTIKHFVYSFEFEVLCKELAALTSSISKDISLTSQEKLYLQADTQLLQIDLLLMQASNSEALQIAQDLTNLFEKNKSSIQYCKACLSLVLILLKFNKCKLAQEYMELLSPIVLNNKDLKEQFYGKLMLYQGKLSYQSKDLLKAEESFAQAISYFADNIEKGFQTEQQRQQEEYFEFVLSLLNAKQSLVYVYSEKQQKKKARKQKQELERFSVNSLTDFKQSAYAYIQNALKFWIMDSRELTHYYDSLQIAKKIYEKGNQNIQLMEFRLGCWLIKLAEFVKANQCFKNIISELQKDDADYKYDLAFCHNHLSRSQLYLENYKAAISSIKIAYDLRMEMTPEGSVHLASTCRTYAQILQALGRVDDAQHKFDEARRISTDLKVSSNRMSTLDCEESALKLEQKNLEKARVQLSAFYEKNRNSSKWDIFTYLRHFPDLCLALGNYDQAIEMAEKLDGIVESQGGPKHPARCSFQLTIAKALFERRKYYDCSQKIFYCIKLCLNSNEGFKKDHVYQQSVELLQKLPTRTLNKRIVHKVINDH